MRIPISGIFKLKVASQKTIKIHTNPTSFISKQLFWDGSNKYEYTPIFKKLISSSKSFIDIGANFGYYSLLAAKLNKDMKIHAFEPSPGPLKYLKDNIQLNGFEKTIFVYDLALSDSDGSVNFYVVKNKKFPTLLNLSGEHNTGSKTLKDSTKIQVDSTSLDVLYKLKKIDDIDLIKIDVEGSENLVINGAELLIKKFKPVIICEILEQKNADLIQEKLGEFGYQYYIFSLKNLEKLDFIRVSQFDKKDFIFIHPENDLNIFRRK